LLSGSDFSFCTPVFALWLFLGFLFCNKGFWSLLKKKKKKKKKFLLEKDFLIA
jgi:hypothetical protein